MRKSCLLFAALLGLIPVCAQSFAPPQEDALKAWRDARFGMFIHWGPVALTGREIGWSRGAPTPVDEYDNLYKRFNPEKFNAEEWVSVAKAAGMKYIVLTTKHHDGFCLWDTKETDYNIMNTPFGRDVVKELSEACKRGGIAFGAYYSTCDWHHPDFPLTSPGGRVTREAYNLDRYTDYLKAQSRELLTHYGPLFTLWYDVPQRFDAKRGSGVIEWVRDIQPSIIVNNRTGARGDYDTPEQRIGGFQLERPWETCMTICRQWAWKPNDPMKSLKECIHTLLRTNGGDGNLLFNVGPTAEGVIEERQVKRLREMGDWLTVNGEAVYGTRGGPYKPAPNVVSTRKDSRVFVHVLEWPEEGVILRTLPIGIKSARLLKGGEVKIQRNGDEMEMVVRPEDRDPVATVIELLLEASAMDIAPLSVIPPGLITPEMKVTASTFYGNGYEAGKATDGDPGTRWATPAGTRQARLDIAFGKALAFNVVEVDEATQGNMGERVQAFDLFATVDGEAKKVFSGNRMGARFQAVLDAPIRATGLSLQIQEASEGPTINEIRVRSIEKAKP